MRLRKPIIPSLLLFLALLLAGCTRNGESITLNIQLDGDLRSDEINLLYFEYVPAEWIDEVGLVLRTCPEDLEANSLVGHHYYVPPRGDPKSIFQVVVSSEQSRQYAQGKTSIKSPRST